MTNRPIARFVVCLAILLLGAVAAYRLEISYLPSWSFPELMVALDLPEPMEVGDLTRRYVQPLESSVRAVGDVASMAGEVDSTGGWMRVRFTAGTDPERKTARIESELSALRRLLPRGASLDVWPQGQGGGDQSMVLWIDRSSGETISRSFIEAVRSLPEVRAVQIAGENRRELRVRAHDEADARHLRQKLESHIAVRRLGEVPAGGKRLPVLVRADATPFSELPIRHGKTLLPLHALARMSFAEESAPWIVRRQGQRGFVLLISREYEASPLALERSLVATVNRFGLGERYDLIVNEAEPLAVLLERLLLGLAAAVAATGLLAAFVLGWRAAISQVLALPVALAAALNAYWLAGFTLDITTLPMLAMALGWSLFFPAFRMAATKSREVKVAAATMLTSALLFPIAASLSAGRLAPLFETPALAFLYAQLAALAALAVLPLPALASPLPRLLIGAPLRAALRRPWSVLLGTLTVTYMLFVLFGAALEPRPGRLSPATSDLRIELLFAEGSTAEQAEAQIALVEKELGEFEEVVEHSSFFNQRWGVVNASLRPADREPRRLHPLVSLLQVKFNSLGTSARVVPLASGISRGESEVRFSDSLEDKAEADLDFEEYGVVLRGADIEVLRTAEAQLKDHVQAVMKYSPGQIRSDWGRPQVRLELTPLPDADSDLVDAALRVLRERAFLTPRRELPSQAELGFRVVDAHAPEKNDDVPLRSRLLGLQTVSGLADTDLLLPEALFETREVIVSPSVKRQQGRFVVPITIQQIGFHTKRIADRALLDRTLSWFSPPAGCDLELPDLSPFFLTEERLRMLGIAGTLPLLLLALAICRLDSIRRGLVTLAPLVIGLAAVTPWIRVSYGYVDEMTLFALAAMLAGGLPFAAEVVAARGTGIGAPDYRWLGRRTLPFLVATVGLTVLLAVPGLGLDDDYHPWTRALGAAAVAGCFICLASYFCIPGLLRSAFHWSQRHERRRRRRTTTEIWRSPGTLELTGHHLTKIYGDDFKALRGIDFRLEPGIIGLLGPNGAGKTTLLRTLCGLLEPTRGQVCYRGIPITPDNLPEYRRLVGFLPQGFNAYPGFTGAQFLDYWALEKGIRDPRTRRREIEYWLAQVGLEDAAGRRVREYSGGMRRRIGIARALLGSPPMVIVDEPTTGLDLHSRNRLRESLLQVAGERIILFSTHIASDVAAAAARILVLHQGRMLYDGSARGLVDATRGLVFEAMIDDEELRNFSHRYQVTTRVRTMDGIRVRAVATADEEPPGRVVEPNLEEAYLAIMGQQSGRRREGQRLTGEILDLDSWRQVA